MEADDFLCRGRALLEYIANYHANLRDRGAVSPGVNPGYLRQLLPSEAPDKSEDWDEIMDDADRFIVQAGVIGHLRTLIEHFIKFG